MWEEEGERAERWCSQLPPPPPPPPPLSLPLFSLFSSPPHPHPPPCLFFTSSFFSIAIFSLFFPLFLSVIYFRGCRAMVDRFWRLGCETADVVCDQPVSRCCVRSLVQSAYSRSCQRGGVGLRLVCSGV